MTNPPAHRTEHSITIKAPASVVYDLIADVTRWPTIFPPSVHVEYVERGVTSERIRIWASANDTVKGWTSLRRLDATRQRVRFRQEVSRPPVAAMGGEWTVEPRTDDRSLVRLTHEFQAVGNDPEHVEWITRAVDHNSDAELSALKTAAEGRAEHDELFLTFDDVVQVDGAAGDVYDFINEARDWPQRLPHVARVELTEDDPGVQLLEMDTRTPDGAVHTTASVRICFPHQKIVYKQLRTPSLMSVHTGEWRFDVDHERARTVVTSTHTVVLRPEAVSTSLGPQATLAEARTFVRTALGRNSTTTMLAAKEHAERLRRSATV